MQKRYELRGIRKAFNAFVSVLLRLGIPMGTTYLLTTMGHRSGRPHTTPVALVVDDGRRWLVSPYGEVGWVHNVRATGRARLTPRSSKSISGEIRSPRRSLTPRRRTLQSGSLPKRAGTLSS